MTLVTRREYGRADGPEPEPAAPLVYVTDQQMRVR